MGIGRADIVGRKVFFEAGIDHDLSFRLVFTSLKIGFQTAWNVGLGSGRLKG
jgi:hypothetical protein